MFNNLSLEVALELAKPRGSLRTKMLNLFDWRVM